MGIKFSEKSSETIDEQAQLFKKLFGSWQSEKSRNEIVNETQSEGKGVIRYLGDKL